MMRKSVLLLIVLALVSAGAMAETWSTSDLLGVSLGDDVHSTESEHVIRNLYHLWLDDCHEYIACEFPLLIYVDESETVDSIVVSTIGFPPVEIVETGRRIITRNPEEARFMEQFSGMDYMTTEIRGIRFEFFLRDDGVVFELARGSGSTYTVHIQRGAMAAKLLENARESRRWWTD